jgi:ferredoxin
MVIITETNDGEMAKKKRLIVRIDESKCTGCGQCLGPCITGALAIIDGKCRLVDESLCDGFGACISACPNDAISLEFREAEEFLEEHVGRLVIATLMKKYGLVEAYIKR